MKHSFRKAVSVLLSVLMLVSLCTVAITSVSAETTTVPTLTDFNIVTGQFGDAEPVVADPVVDGGYAVTLNVNRGARRGYLLSDGTDSNADNNIDPFMPVDATYYTVRFDYYIESASGDLGFMLYYGAEDPAVSKAGGEINAYSANGSAKNFCNDDAYIESVTGDGKWHTAAINFKAVSNRTNGSDDELPYLYLTAYAGSDNGTNHMLGYVKNIEIITETAAVSYINDDIDLSGYFNADGTPNADMFQEFENVGMASPMIYSKKTDDGYVFVPTSDVLNTAHTYGQNQYASADYIQLLEDDGSAYSPSSDTGFNSFAQDAAHNRYCVVKYKVTKLGDSKFATIGFGRNSITTGKETTTLVYSSIKVTATSNEWRYAVLYMTSNSAQGNLRLAFGGKDAEIVIGSVYYSYTGRNANVVLATFNDNGGSLQIRAGYKGTDIAYYAADGANAENLAMGEKFMGWYADANFSTPITTFPETGGTLYARYPSTIIDFNNRTSWTANYGSNSSTVTATSDNAAGTWTVAFGSTTGVMIPSYDAAISDKVAMSDTTYGTRYEAFYQFKEGTQYKITYVYTVSEDVGTLSKPMTHTVANAASTGVRDNGGSAELKHTLSAEAGVWSTSSLEFTADVAESSTKPVYSYGEGSDDDIFGICIRNVGTTVIFDKIIITEISDETRTGYATKIIIDDGETEVVYDEPKVGDLIVMPEAPEKADHMFVGWYVNTYDPTLSNKHKSTDAIPVSALTVSSDMIGETTTYVPHYIKTATETVDFEEEEYQGTDVGGYAWSEIIPDGTDANTTPDSTGDRSGFWRIAVDEGSTDHYALIEANANANFWKIALFTDAGNYIPAYEGVTYEITMKYEVLASGKSTDQAIGIVRSNPKGYLPIALDGVGQGETQFGTAATLGEATKSQTVRVENIYEAFDNTSAAGAYTCSTIFSVVVRSGNVKIHEVSITPVSYTAPALHEIDLTKGSVDIDYENGTVTVTPNDGYEVSAAGITARQSYKDYTVTDSTATITETEVETFNLMPTKDGGSTDDGLTFKFDNNIEGARLSSYQFYADFVEKSDATVNAATIGFSVREASGSGDTYESAGIRFRFRASEQTVANADKVEFVIVPTAALGENDIATYMANDGSAAVTGVALDATQHIVYEEVGTYTDYQAILTGLTDENGKDLTGLKLSVALRVTVGETETYVEDGASVCYDDYFAN